MTLGVGIVGLPNVGKTTLFNALTRAGAGVASYAFSTVEPNTAMVEVPDKRLDVLAQMYKPKKVTPTVMKFVDVAGLVAGASRGEGMGNQFLSNIRELDALAMVVRAFTDPNVQHVDSKLDPRRDMGMVNLELALADLDVVNKRREKIAGTARLKPGAKEKEELELLDRLAAHLDEGKPIRTLSFDARDVGQSDRVDGPYTTSDLADDVAGALCVPRAQEVRADGPRRWLQFNRLDTTAAELIAEVAARYRLQDLTIEEPDIERIVRRIYEEGLSPLEPVARGG